MKRANVLVWGSGSLAAGLAAVLISSLVFAGGERAPSPKKAARDPYFVIQHRAVEEIAESPEDQQRAIQAYLEAQKAPRPVVGTVDPAEIIQLGSRLWQLVAENKPVVNFTQKYGFGVPQGVEDWRQLEGWKRPQTRAFRVRYTNGYGIEVVTFTFRVIFTPGGSLNGKGRYLTHVTIFPVDVDVAWAYTLNASVHIPGVVNVGTKADPVAGMEIHASWSVETILGISQGSWGFFVQGDGRFEQLGETKPGTHLQHFLDESSQNHYLTDSKDFRSERQIHD